MPTYTWVPKIVYGGTPTTITFDHPPSLDPFNEVINYDSDVVVSNAGVQQVNFNHKETVWKVNFDLVSSTLVGSMKTFMDWARTGGSFTYYWDKDTAGSATTVTLHKDSLKGIEFVRQVADGSGDFLYKFTFVMRQVST